MIWIIGGTSDANIIAQKLTEKGCSVTLSAATSYGKKLADSLGFSVIEGKMNQEQMQEQFSKADYVIDASHPFAEEVSANAIAACQAVNAPYLRYERENKQFDYAQYYNTYDELIAALKQSTGNIFLTIGSNNIHLFSDLKDRIIARVLPVKDSIEKCEAAGIPVHQIIASKGIFQEETNLALYKEYEAKHLVTKDSGDAGGISSKVEVAYRNNMIIHILRRPQIAYPNKTNSIEDIINAIIK